MKFKIINTFMNECKVLRSFKIFIKFCNDAPLANVTRAFKKHEPTFRDIEESVFVLFSILRFSLTT